MKLKNLLDGVNVKEIIGDDNVDITDVRADSYSVTKGCLYICIKGLKCNGQDYVRQAVKYGANAVISESPCDTFVTQVIVDNARKAMSVIAANYYGNAHKKLKIIGITGTNGKTTTSQIIKSIMDESGEKCAVIGTNGVFYGSKTVETGMTTPDPLVLHKLFADMVSDDIKYVVMEVSAHALYFDKVEGINFFIGVLTNLTQDHFDFFGNMEEYKKAKKKLFEKGRCKYILANSDDPFGQELIKDENALSFGLNNPSDVFCINVKESLKKTEFVLNLFDQIYNVKINLIGEFNVYNVMAAAAVAALCGIKGDNVFKGIKKIKKVSGRMETVYDGDYKVIIDYAHTPDGLGKALQAVKSTCSNKVVCVFGCGGNRDDSKRKIMGKISGENADFTVITSDNPRYEDPMAIIYEIEKGIIPVSKNYVLVSEREEAIKYAINYAKKGDVVLVCGKGCEKYQEKLGIKRLYNDKDTIMNVIGGKEFDKGID